MGMKKYNLKIVFKRILHPVGQGAFFSEQFFDAIRGNVLYNVVYDCGSKSSNIQKQMERSIKSTLHDKKEIDAMFLSHFDDDHINFVNYLKITGHLSGTRLFIPMLKEEEWLGIEPLATNYKFILSLNDTSVNGTRVIKVDFDEDDASERKADEEKNPLRSIRVIEEIQDDVIPSGTPLTPNISKKGYIWYYTPFNVRFKTLITDFMGKLKAANLSYSKLSDKKYVTEHLEELKKIYKNLGKAPTNGTAVNLNSLLVMSYPDRVERCCEYGNNLVCDMYFPEWFRWNIGYTKNWLVMNQLYPGSCLYTGDTSANDPVVWKRIEAMISKCLGSKHRLTLIQVPHHGSKYSYDQNLVNSNKYYAGFTNYDPFYRQRIFDDKLTMKFALQKKPLILVIREYRSQFEEYWRLKV